MSKLTFASSVNRWHDETALDHAMHDVDGVSLPICGAKQYAFTGHRAAPSKSLCGNCRRIIGGAITRGMRRAFFASAWAEQAEETGHSAELVGKDIMEIMPRTVDASCHCAARTLWFDMEARNGGSLDVVDLFARACGLPTDGADRELTPEAFGHYCAMQAMGHGVGLESFGHAVNDSIHVPRVEFGSYSLARDYFVDLTSTHD
ncbi:MAG: hypothetical protein KDG50_06915 [Chromatiales bacterium]|nr:hypothetical protein [Chromatiales bacterium]